MSCRARYRACFGASILLFALPHAGAQDDQLAFRNLFEKAREHSDVNAKGMPGFVLRGDVRIWVKKDAANNGKYLFVWTPEGKWKEQVVLPGYKRTRIGDGTQFWQVRSSEAESPAVGELDLLLKNRRAPKTQEDDRFSKTGLKQVAEASAKCIKQSARPPFGWIYCSSGDLIEVSSGHNTTDIPWKVDWQEHSNFQDWSSKRIPLLLRGHNGKQTALEVEFKELKPLPQLPADFFAPPEGATSWADCREDAIWKLKQRVQPEYPQSARMQHRQGTVTLCAVIGEDGTLSDLKIGHSAGQELDQSAAAAVSHWRYERTTACPEAKGRTETFIDVIYSLNI